MKIPRSWLADVVVVLSFLTGYVAATWLYDKVVDSLRRAGRRSRARG